MSLLPIHGKKEAKIMILSPTKIAHTYVQLMLRLSYGQHRLHFSVQTKNRRTPPTGIRYDWQNGCLFGISFPRRDSAAAEAWIAEAILAGHCPLYSFRKRGSACCPSDIRKLLENAAAQP
jgi:hypothetical protein